MKSKGVDIDSNCYQYSALAVKLVIGSSLTTGSIVWFMFIHTAMFTCVQWWKIEVAHH